MARGLIARHTRLKAVSHSRQPPPGRLSMGQSSTSGGGGSCGESYGDEEADGGGGPVFEGRGGEQEEEVPVPVHFLPYRNLFFSIPALTRSHRFAR
jgi:hypothetical protein